VCRNILALLECQERLAAADRECSAPFGPGIRLVMLAACVARTPDVALPRIPELEEPGRLHAVSQAGHRIPEVAAPEPAAAPARDLRRSSAADHLVLDPSSASGES
jgi:hypothetical protein